MGKDTKWTHQTTAHCSVNSSENGSLPKTNLMMECKYFIHFKTRHRTSWLGNPPTTQRSSNCSTTLLFMTIMLCGDIELNPGPIRYPCGNCGKPVASNHRALECDSCNMWYHIKCGGISAATYSSILNIESEGKEYQWECQRCSLPKLNDSFFNNTTEEEILEDSLESPPASPPRSNIHKSSKLKIMTMNCRGIKSLRKRAELYATLDRENPDILLGTESHLDSSVYNAEVFPEDTGYNIIRKDRNKHGGGVFIAYKDYLTVTHIPEIGKTSESVFAKVKVQKDQFMYVGCVYRPPDTKEHTLLATHEDLRQLLGKERLPHVVLGGDFNAPSCNWEYLNYPPSPSYGNKINELLLDIVRD